jgi:hypothetical protein
MSWTDDARFISIALGANKWDVGLRIARSIVRPVVVDIRDLHGNFAASMSEDGRVTAEQFAKRAKVSGGTIRRWYWAWELAADDGIVDHAEKLDSDTTYKWAGLVDFGHYVKQIGLVDRWLRAESRWEKDEAQRKEDDLRAIVGEAKTAAEVEEAIAAEAEKPGSILEAIPGIEDESRRRDALRALQRGAKALHDLWNQIASEHTHTGVADEVAWLHDVTSHLTEIQWGIGAFIVESKEASERA